MTTRKPYHGQDGPVIFGRPTIGPRVYLVKGPSGWSESFDRKLADKALVAFLAPLHVDQLVAPFLTSTQLEAKEETWIDIANYLGKITQQPARGIPEIVIVAFWAAVVLHEEQEGTN